MAMTLDGSNGVTFNDSSLQGAAASPFGLKNRIINGDCRIDQRNAGASVTGNSYALDRFRASIFNIDQLVLTTQQDTSAPAGFVNSYKATVTTAETTFTDTEDCSIMQLVEGNNIADLGWGTANASTVTLSFWVRSSLTGTFGGCLQNNGGSRSYPFSYTISSANTWEYKTITIEGETTGTWLTTNGLGLRVNWSLGNGVDRLGTAGAWTSSNHRGVTGQVQLAETVNATWQITGIQLEKGSTATPFERRLYGQELINCQRYYYRNKAIAAGNRFGSLFCETTTLAQCIIPFPVSMRTNPTALEQSGTAGDYTVFAGGAVTTCNSVPVIGNATTEACNTVFSVASGLTIGHGGAARAANTNAYLGFSAEL